MIRQHCRHTIMSLSACSIPVMLAVAGLSATAQATEGQRTLAIHDGVFLQSSADIEAVLRQGNTPQSGACWICMAPDNQHFWVSKGQDAAISAYRVSDSGDHELVEKVNVFDSLSRISELLMARATVDGWIDLELSDDGQYLHQVFGESGMIAVYEIDEGSLSLVEILGA